MQLLLVILCALLLTSNQALPHPGKPEITRLGTAVIETDGKPEPHNSRKTNNEQYGKPTTIKCGADQTELYLGELQGKRIALVVNPASRIASVLLADSLISLKIQVKKIFAPEHGFRGTADAGQSLADSKDIKTGLPVISLYGKHMMPSAADLQDLDVVVFDLQDVGARFYTYLSTLHYVMKACAMNHKKLIVLDRPNPNGFSIDGPILDTLTSRSFVGMHPVPITYGMTIGEYARMVNGENWLERGLKVDLQVIPLGGYTHQSLYELPVQPSPNLLNIDAIHLYPSLCLFEGTVISVGRGTDFPFQVFGHPLLMNEKFTFKPRSIAGRSTHPPFENQECRGMDLRFVSLRGRTKNEASFNSAFLHSATFNSAPLKKASNLNLLPDTINLGYLLKAYREFPNKTHFFNGFFQKLAGTPELKKQIEAGFTEAQIRLSWKAPLELFKKIRAKYLLYP